MFRCFHTVFRHSSHFIIFFTLGVGLSIFLIPFFDQKDCNSFTLKVENFHSRNTLQDIDAYEPKINLAAKPRNALKSGHGLIRPRFHKAELGIRNKLFLGILTTSESISSLAVALNKTVSKFVDKVMFFIDAPSAQRLNVSLLKLPGIVGFTDTRNNLKPFHLFKYVSDNFLEDYDFFFIAKDTCYIQAQKLYEFTKKISINHDIHVGRVAKQSHITDTICSLDYGILLSNSVMKKVQRSLEWCVRNSLSKDDSVNIGQCVIHASNVPCSDFVQGSKFQTYSMKKEQSGSLIIPTDVNDLRRFDQSVVVAPLLNAEQYFYIHFYYSLITAESVGETIDGLRISAIKLSNSKTVETKMWPVASQPAATPLSHFDVLRWEHFTLTHKYLNNDFTNLVTLSGPEEKDIHRIVAKSVAYIEGIYSGALKFYNFVNGYQRFDPARGMDYIIDLAFRETTSGKTLHKSVGQQLCLHAYQLPDRIGLLLLWPIDLKYSNLLEK